MTRRAISPARRAWRSRPLWSLIFLGLALLLLLAAGAWRERQLFLTRGIPAGLPEPIPHGGTQPGLNVHLDQYDDERLAETLERIAAAGVRHLKQPFYFGPAFDWAEADRLVASVSERQLELIPLLDGDPANQFAPPANPADFAAWAGEFAARYGDRLTYYIIWDEPNLASHWGDQPVNPVEYAALLTAASQAIRAADPNAVIVAAPLAPTVETGPLNLAEDLYLQALYDAGAGPAFDAAAGKAYGFDTGPADRRVSRQVLNFSRIILLREVLERQGEGHKAVWVGNWGWNSLPAGWSGQPSLWGQTDEQTQAERTLAALERGRREWPWMGVMFLENWQPAGRDDDARWGFAIAGRPAEAALARFNDQEGLAFPGFHLAQEDHPAQAFSGAWRFSPDFGADIGQSGDAATWRFWGSEVGLRVRRADYRARLYVTVNGQPANALPQDERGSALVLTAPDPHEDWLSTETVARNLPPGRHELTLTAERGWDQWALHGFSVAYRPPDRGYRWGMGGLLAAAGLFLLLSLRAGWGADWGRAGAAVSGVMARLSERQKAFLTLTAGTLAALSGWLTWGEQAAGLYRRLGDNGQLFLTAATASIFYVAPSFFIFAPALLLLFLLLIFRPAWGLALVAFSFPFYVTDLLKPVWQYRFSPVEIFTLVTFAAAFIAGRQVILAWLSRPIADSARAILRSPVVIFLLAATLSLFFTERLGVALHEWRVVIIGPALFYLAMRLARPSAPEMWRILDAFVLSGVTVALIGLWQIGFDRESLITAEGGLMRLRATYGSPNNVALYLGRILPLLLAMLLLGRGSRRRLYGLLLLPVGLALVLTFSRGALFLGLPVGVGLVFAYWQRLNGRRAWPWLVGTAAAAALALLVALQIPALAARLDPQGITGFFRLNLWRASLNMIADHPIWGVGLDNFLYAYRGRYIFEAAWQEPNLNHPHNIILDFASRLGLIGLLAGGWLFWRFWQIARRLPERVGPAWKPAAVGLIGGFGHMLAHGLVDHSFFLVDLAYAFYLMMGVVVWLDQSDKE